MDVSTTAAEQHASALEKTFRVLVGDASMKSNEADFIRALAADRDRLRFFDQEELVNSVIQATNADPVFANVPFAVRETVIRRFVATLATCR